MDLEQQGDAAVTQAVDVPELPERAAPVERLPEDVADQSIEPAVVAGRADGRLANVRVDIDLGHVLPHRTVEATGHLHDAPPEQSEEGEPPRDEASDLLRTEARGGVGVERREHPDVHVPLGRLRRQEPGVGPAQPLHLAIVPGLGPCC